MSDHPQPAEIFDEYALGALEGEELRALEQHVKDCPECQGEVQKARARVALLALSAPRTAPSSAVKERLMSRVAAERAGSAQDRSRASAPAAAQKRGSFWNWGIAALAAIVALAIATGVLALRNHHLHTRIQSLESQQTQQAAHEERQAAKMARAEAILDVLTSPNTLKVSLISAQAHPVPQGKAFYNPAKGLVFYAANLPHLPSSQTYQLWLVPEQGNPVSAGIFATDSRGNGEVLLPPLPPGIAAKAFAVTVEPAGGKPQPTGAKVLIGAVS
ncbi:MAG TPA: anti-sigma factor [Terriglobia bacterium]|nr:anti-sigma factor [Terriglobia bacterium]